MSGDRHTEDRRWDAVLLKLQRGYADAVVGGAEAVAERVVREAIDAGLPETVISGEVILPAMRAIGDLLQEGALSLADGDAAMAICIRALALQREAFRCRRRRAAHRVVLAGVEGERHALGLSMAGSVLDRAGYDVRMLGPDLPLADLTAAIERYSPSVVGLSVTHPPLAAVLPEVIDEIRRASPRTGVVVGGPVAPQALAVRPGVLVCRHVADAVEATDALIHRAELN